MRLSQCNNTSDFRRLAKQRLPRPIFDYIDGGADDEVTMRKNSSAFECCDLVPNVLTGVSEVNLETTVLGRKLDLPFFMSPTALQRLFHHDGELAVARAAEKFGTMFGVSTLGTHSIEALGEASSAPKIFQIYVHNDHGLTSELIARCKASAYDALALTVDTIVAGNRERDIVSGMTTPPKLSLRSLFSFATHPGWAGNYLLRKRFDLPNVPRSVAQISQVASSVGAYIDQQLRRNITWEDAARMIEEWGGAFAIKGIMSVADARRAVDVGASAIFLSNHGGRQLDGSRTPFDQLADIVAAVGGEIEIVLDGGIRRGTHILKALALGATACSVGRAYLFALAAAGQPGVERNLGLLRAELERGMMLMGCETVSDLSPDMLAWNHDR